jgi:hypothetical protein
MMRRMNGKTIAADAIRARQTLDLHPRGIESAAHRRPGAGTDFSEEPGGTRCPALRIAGFVFEGFNLEFELVVLIVRREEDFRAGLEQRLDVGF